MENVFTLFGREFAFTYVGDRISMYEFGAKSYINDNGNYVKDESTRRYWHKIGFGFYRRSDSWLR